MAEFRKIEAIYAPQCRMEHVTRSMIIVEFVLSIVAVGISAWGLKRMKRRWEEVVEMKKARNAYFHQDDEGDGDGWS